MKIFELNLDIPLKSVQKLEFPEAPRKIVRTDSSQHATMRILADIHFMIYKEPYHIKDHFFMSYEYEMGLERKKYESR